MEKIKVDDISGVRAFLYFSGFVGSIVGLCYIVTPQKNANQDKPPSEYVIPSKPHEYSAPKPSSSAKPPASAKPQTSSSANSLSSDPEIKGKHDDFNRKKKKEAPKTHPMGHMIKR